MMKTLKLIVSVLLFTTGMLYAQETIPVTGGDAAGSGGKVSYTVGQIAFMQNVGATGSALQGVQQPYEISVLTGRNNTDEVNLNVSAYPNPTQDNLILKVNKPTASVQSFTLYDMKGEVLESGSIEKDETLIHMDRLEAATYFIIISDKKEVLKTFKIIKK